MTNQEIATITATLLELIDRRGETPRQRNQSHAQAFALKSALRAEYGIRRGWTQSKADFRFDTLASGKQHDGGYRAYDPMAPESASGRIVDHQTYWKAGRQPVAIVLQPYVNREAAEPALTEWAARCGLKVTFPTDFPSWWYPGVTTLIEVTRS